MLALLVPLGAMNLTVMFLHPTRVHRLVKTSSKAEPGRPDFSVLRFRPRAIFIVDYSKHTALSCGVRV